jgi:hypothetical protein
MLLLAVKKLELDKRKFLINRRTVLRHKKLTALQRHYLV